LEEVKGDDTMTKQPDDLEAVRTLVSTLEGFEKADRERIMRWACEKLGLPYAGSGSTAELVRTGTLKKDPSLQGSGGTGGTKDMKAFVAEKEPSSDNQFAATVAYYYRFEAPDAERKDAITRDDLQDACRKAGRARLTNPSQTLINAFKGGLIDKPERGLYAINSVGENLVAMTLPGKASASPGPKGRTRMKKEIKESPTKPNSRSRKRSE
jgi:hypothetical protein